MLKAIKYVYGAALFLVMPIIGYSTNASFYKGLVNCEDNEKIIKIINTTKNENRIMCLDKNHKLHDYLNKSKGDDLKIESINKSHLMK